jgi:hypothetical protein
MRRITFAWMYGNSCQWGYDHNNCPEHHSLKSTNADHPGLRSKQRSVPADR